MEATDLPDAGESVDLILRHITRRFPEDFARALHPPGARIRSATWLDTQVTSRQRRLDRVLEVVVHRGRILEHTEWQMAWHSDVPFRVFEYNVMTALAVAHEEPPPRIRSTVVLLSGREEPWSTQGVYKTSPRGAPFSGVRFGIDAVYQRTIAELSARGSPLWMVFAPLAVDADPKGMERVLGMLREQVTENEFEELAVALTVMADADKRNRGLRHAILPLLREEIIMESWVYTQGKLKGIEEGKLKGIEEGKLKGIEEGKLRGLEEGKLRGIEEGKLRDIEEG
ncbi:MAG: Yae1 family protein, partial [Polyangiaceae bacterium]